MVFLSPHRLESTEQSRQDVMPQAMLRLFTEMADYTLRAFGDVHTPLSPAIPLCGVACFLTLRAEIPGIDSCRTLASVDMVRASIIFRSSNCSSPLAQHAILPESVRQHRAPRRPP
ncbi:hypothetical protein SCP_0400370 [Sparassis crispa]|uniref:Uncharacterized protein n=1 Tax=Sparassis crispa TaxID=139825 RepID=A0A401GHK3_9APHY|nr:hypothetical protein SCP_0400370 [Sparassis crispa]GBE81666.1 hypothetical protein SCP_0400370 [Sparassis crispa]